MVIRKTAKNLTLRTYPNPTMDFNQVHLQPTWTPKHCDAEVAMRNVFVCAYRWIFCKIPVAFRFRQMWWKGPLANSVNRLNSLSRYQALEFTHCYAH